jgi:hypothetical protein
LSKYVLFDQFDCSIFLYLISSIELLPSMVRHILRRIQKRKPTPINMDVLFLLLDDDADIIDIATTLILADEETNDDEMVVHHVEEEPPPAVWGGSRPGKAPNLERHGGGFWARVRARF